METKRTDKKMLSKGVQTLFITIFLMFAGPTLLYIALSNKDKSIYIPLLILSLLICAAAIYSGFKGLKTIMNSMFGEKK